MSGPYRGEREPCARCAERDAAAKLAPKPPMTANQRGVLALAVACAVVFAFAAGTIRAFVASYPAVWGGLCVVDVFVFMTAPIWFTAIENWVKSGT